MRNSIIRLSRQNSKPSRLLSAILLARYIDERFGKNNKSGDVKNGK